jgi:hypothetical protein
LKGRVRLAFFHFASAGLKRDIHLIELESVLFAGPIRRYRPVMIEDVVDKLRPFGLGQP